MPLTRSIIEQEDMAMWKFAMEDHPGYGRKTQWKLFREKNASKRTAQSLYIRFHQYLLPNLSKTKFHVETKLILCQKYDVKVEDEFLKKLQEDANVELDEYGYVFRYQLKPNCRQNMDMEMNDEEFREITTRLFPSCKHWTHEEESGLWNYLLENSESYARGKQQFWKELIAKLNWNRTPLALKNTFHRRLAMNLHETEFSIEQKLKLYKNCQISVDKEYLKTLQEHANLEFDRNGYIIDYKMKRAAKRRNSEEIGREAEKAGRNSPVLSSEDQEEEDLVIYGAVAGVPKIEVAHDDDEPTIEDLNLIFNFEPKAELFDETKLENPEPIHEETEIYDDETRESMDRGSEDQSESIAKMLEIMQRIEQKMENQFNNQEAAHKNDKLEIRKAFKTSRNQVSELSKTVASMQSEGKSQEADLKKDMSESFQKLAEEMSSLQGEMRIIRNQINGIPDDASTRRKYLLNLKKFVSSLESPELEAVEQRIDTELQNLPENDDNPIPTKVLSGILEALIRF